MNMQEQIVFQLGNHHQQLSGEDYHGGLDARELKQLGIDPHQAVDFSSNILASGPSPLVRQAVANSMLAAYPDRDCVELREAIAERLRIDPAVILIGNGSCELIHLVARTLIRPGDAVLIVGPTFSEYERASRLMMAEVIQCRASVANQFAVPVDQIEATLESESVKVVWLCNPNNPTGSSVSSQRILNWADSHPGTIFIVDESYIDFAVEAKSLIDQHASNIVVLRSMTKCYAMAGLRLGYLVARPEYCHRFSAQRVPWTVSAPAQAAGIAALRDESFYRKAISVTLESTRELLDDLSKRGFSPVATDVNYFLLPVENAQHVRRALLARGLVVRDCTSFGLPDCLRIAVRDPSNNVRLAQSLSSVTRSIAQQSNDDSTRFAFQAIPLDTSQETPQPSFNPTVWDSGFQVQLRNLFRLRRDVRRFRPDAILRESLQRWIEAACLAPSVGLSQPWKLVSVHDGKRRLRMVKEYESQNEIASEQYDSAAAAEYRKLKLSGMKEAPEHLAVFVDPDPSQGRGLGRRTMPESVAYSVVAAIQNFWLAARSDGVGVGWVSILRPEVINEILEVPGHWQLIAYLCIGYPLHSEVDVPELESLGWENRITLEQQWHQR